MTDQIIDLSEAPARLRAGNGLLSITRGDSGEIVTVPFADIACLVASHPQITWTQAVIAGLARTGAAFVCCDEKHMPCAMLLPLDAHITQSERFARQAAASLPLKKRLWREIVRAKLRAQSRALAELRGDDEGIAALAKRVRSGDPENMEARASRRYWPALFARPGFRRERGEPDENRLLNYGYAVLRAIVARAVCAAGLHCT